MSTIVTRVGKGSPLTWTEVDSNFTNLNTDKLQSGNTAAALTITSATINGGAINGTTIGASTASTGRFSDLTDTGLTSGRVTYASTGGNLVDSANLTFNGTTLTSGGYSTGGNLTFTGTGNRITGDFSNATPANRTAFQTSTTNSNTALLTIPNGTATFSGWQFVNNSDANNSSFLQVGASSSSAAIVSSIFGTGSFLPMTFFTGGAERMRIDTSGNLGVGTSSPTALLNVHNAQASGTTATMQRWSWSSTDPASSWGLRLDQIHTGSAIEYALRVKNGSTLHDSLYLQASGNVGIGTSNPSYRLDVRTSFDAVQMFATNGTVQQAVGYCSGGLAISGAITSHPYVFLTSNAERMRIDTSGNVGIGTASPNFNSATGTVCHINNSTVGAWSLNHYTNGTTGSAATDGFIVGALGGECYVYNYENTPLVFGTNNTERMRIDSSGNLLVGITSARANAGDIQVSKGISFPATQSAQSDANTLDDYEEGTWTPTVVPTSGSITSQTNTGSYTKIGRQVTVTFSCSITNVGTATALSSISGLPFTSASTFVGCGRENAATGSMWQFLLGNGQAAINGWNYANSSTIATNYNIIGTLTYFS